MPSNKILIRMVNGFRLATKQRGDRSKHFLRLARKCVRYQFLNYSTAAVLLTGLALSIS